MEGYNAVTIRFFNENMRMREEALGNRMFETIYVVQEIDARLGVPLDASEVKLPEQFTLSKIGERGINPYKFVRLSKVTRINGKSAAAGEP